MIPTNTFRVLTLLALCFIARPANAQSLGFKIISDNDFAMFVGDASGPTRELYQNNVDWPSQIAAAASFSFDLEPGETYVYLLAMGGGSVENIGGYINGVNIALLNLMASSPLSAPGPLGEDYLTNYKTPVDGSGFYTNVVNGSYSASLADVQSAFSYLTWSLAAWSNAGVGATVNGLSYSHPSHTAVLLAIPAHLIPEPGTATLLAMGSASLLLRRRRRL